MRVLGKMIPYLISMMSKKPDTTAYPAAHAQVSERFRGALKFNADSCIGCRLCCRVCPANAIEIVKLEGEEKRFKAVVRMDKCIFCGQCVDTCNKNALENTKDFELACTDRKSLEVEI